MSGVLITVSVVLMLALALLLDRRARTKHGGSTGSGRSARALRDDASARMQNEAAKADLASYQRGTSWGGSGG